MLCCVKCISEVAACDRLVYVLLVFFFFKQKTAYEMRISDWSSDVCSSDLLTLGTERGALRSFNGVAVQADIHIDQAWAAYDVLLVPGGPGAYNEQHPGLHTWLRAAAQRATRHGSICTGVFVLGEAGLLDGYRVTPHWHYTERLNSGFSK